MSATGCIFCRIAKGELSAEVVHEDAEVVAFRDVNPQAPVHVLVVPRRHVSSLDGLSEADESLAGKLLLAVRSIARSEGVADDGFRVVVNSGERAGQTVDHLHVHLLGGRRMTWPPG
jgi:histidine triad (HIT) family protein